MARRSEHPARGGAQQRVCAQNLRLRSKRLARILQIAGWNTRTSLPASWQTEGTEDTTENPRLAMFFPFLQSPPSATSLVVRCNGHPQQLVPALRAALRDLDAGLPPKIGTWSKRGVRDWTRFCLPRAWPRFRPACPELTATPVQLAGASKGSLSPKCAGAFSETCVNTSRPSKRWERSSKSRSKLIGISKWGAIIRRCCCELGAPAPLFKRIKGIEPGFAFGAPAANRRHSLYLCRVALSLGLPPAASGAHIVEALASVRAAVPLPHASSRAPV